MPKKPAKRNNYTAQAKNKPKTWFHRKRNTKKWQFIVKDKYAIAAKKAGFRARSIYKLQEIQERFWLIKEKMDVIDIWAAPGSFLQLISQIIKDRIIIWVDLKEIKKFSNKNIKTIVCDIFDFEKLKGEIEKIYLENDSKKEIIFDLITSDIAPNTTGRKDVDQYASVELNIEICKFADKFLKKGWNMLLKVFVWEDFIDLQKEIKKRFKSYKTYKPLACRDSSFEEYIICLDKK